MKQLMKHTNLNYFIGFYYLLYISDSNLVPLYNLYISNYTILVSTLNMTTLNQILEDCIESSC